MLVREPPVKLNQSTCRGGEERRIGFGDRSGKDPPQAGGMHQNWERIDPQPTRGFRISVRRFKWVPHQHL